MVEIMLLIFSRVVFKLCARLPISSSDLMEIVFVRSPVEISTRVSATRLNGLVIDLPIRIAVIIPAMSFPAI
jgi:hypothetical protein